jgi:hypothetical protein
MIMTDDMPAKKTNVPEVSDGGKAREVTRVLYGYSLLPPLVPSARCKHGHADCLTCGATERRDVVHSTAGGRGVVGRIRR